MFRAHRAFFLLRARPGVYVYLTCASALAWWREPCGMHGLTYTHGTEETESLAQTSPHHCCVVCHHALTSRRRARTTQYERVVVLPSTKQREEPERWEREERSTRDQASCDCEGSASAPWLSRLVARRLSALARRLPGHSGPSGQVSAPRLRPSSRKWLWTRRRARLRADAAAAAALRGRAGRGARRLAAAGIRSSRR